MPMPLLDSSKTGQLTLDGRTYRARQFQVGGKVLELYPIGVLSKAIGRSEERVRIWERAGLIPKSLFRVTGNVRTEAIRWYSREQIINLYQVKNRFPFSAGGKPEDRERLRDLFFTAFTMVFDEGAVINVSRLEFKPRSIPAVTHATNKRTGAAISRTAAPGGTVARSAPPARVYGAGIAPKEPQSPGRSILDTSAGRRHPTPTDHAQRTDHRVQPVERAIRTGEPAGTRSGHDTGSGQRGAEGKRASYRRRPASRV